MTYQPVPLNWIAGADGSLLTFRPQVGQEVSGLSENFRISSKRPHLSHWYS